MVGTNFLEEQVALFQKRVSDEAWRSARLDIEMKPQVDDGVAHALFIVNRIRRRNRMLSEAGHAAHWLALPREQTDCLIRLYKSWLEVTSQLLKTAGAMEKLGHSFKQLAKLRHAEFLVRSLGLDDADRTRQSIIDAIQGRVKPLREAADEFRRRRYGRSA
jgi:hypothetical protein